MIARMSDAASGLNAHDHRPVRARQARCCRDQYWQMLPSRDDTGVIAAYRPAPEDGPGQPPAATDAVGSTDRGVGTRWSRLRGDGEGRTTHDGSEVTTTSGYPVQRVGPTSGYAGNGGPTRQDDVLGEDFRGAGHARRGSELGATQHSNRRWATGGSCGAGTGPGAGHDRRDADDGGLDRDLDRGAAV